MCVPEIPVLARTQNSNFCKIARPDIFVYFCDTRGYLDHMDEKKLRISNILLLDAQILNLLERMVCLYISRDWLKPNRTELRGSFRFKKEIG